MSLFDILIYNYGTHNAKVSGSIPLTRTNVFMIKLVVKFDFNAMYIKYVAFFY